MIAWRARQSVIGAGAKWLLAGMLGAVCVASPAQACSSLTPAGMEKFERYKRRELAKVDLVVTGTWTFTDKLEDSPSGSRWGTVTTVAKSRQPSRTIAVWSSQDLTCGFPYFPSDADPQFNPPNFGKFYLNRMPNSETYTLRHFEPIERCR